LGRVGGIEPLFMKPPFTIGEGDAQIQGDNLQELFDKRVDPNGTVLGNQNIELERSRIQAKRTAMSLRTLHDHSRTLCCPFFG